MALRLTVEDLDNLKPGIRRQVSGHLEGVDDHVPVNCAPQRHAKARPEEDAGRNLVTWIDLLTMPNGLKPGLFFFHVPNGLARNATEGGIFKAQGLRKGWPDYCLDLPMNGYNGLRLELKAPNGSKPTADQLDILTRLESVGFKCCVAWGFDEARDYIERYLDITR